MNEIINYLSSLTNGFSFNGILVQVNNIFLIFITLIIGYKLKEHILKAIIISLLFYNFFKAITIIIPYRSLLLGIFYIIYRLFNKLYSNKKNNITNIKLTKFGDILFNAVPVAIIILMLISFIIRLVIKLLKGGSVGIFGIIILLIVGIVLYLFVYDLFKYFILFRKAKILDNQICDINGNKIITIRINPYLLNVNFIYKGKKLKVNCYKLSSLTSNNGSYTEKKFDLCFFKYKLLLKNLIESGGKLISNGNNEFSFSYNIGNLNSHRGTIIDKMIYEFDIINKKIDIIKYHSSDIST